MSRWFSSLMCLLFVAAVPAASQAATVTVVVSGTVNIAGASPLSGAFSPGQTVSFSIVLDDSLPDTAPFAGTGSYDPGVVSLSGSVGSYAVASSNGVLQVHDNTLSGSSRDGFTMSNFDAVSGSDVAGLSLIDMRVVVGSGNEFVSGDEFPTLAELNGFVSTGLFGGTTWNYLSFSDGATTARVGWTVDSMTVPEPSLAGLVGLGAVALVLGGRSSGSRR